MIIPFRFFRHGLLITLTSLFSSSLQAQGIPVKAWDKTFGGSAADELSCLRQTADGGYILGGYSASGISGEKSDPRKDNFGFGDYWLVKTDNAGQKLWDKTIGGNEGDILTALQQTTDGGYIVGGNSESDAGTDKTQNCQGTDDYWILKLDVNGNKIWDKTFGGNNVDQLVTLQQTTDGGYILGGFTYSSASGDKTQPSRGGLDYWILKLDSNGNKVWDKGFGGSGNDYLRAVVPTSDGGYLVGGYSESQMSGDKNWFTLGGTDYWIIKLDANGNKVWDRAYGGSSNDNLFAMQQTSDNNFILGGWSFSGVSIYKSQPALGFSDYWIIKINQSGDIIWDKTLGGMSGDNLATLQQTTDGGFILGGVSGSDIGGDKTQNCRGDSDYWFVKTDASGNLQWDFTLGGNDEDLLYSLQQTADGGFIAGGASGSGLGGDKSHNSRGSVDFWVVKIDNNVSTGITAFDSGKNIGIYPNPAALGTTITVTKSALIYSAARILIYDGTGKLIRQSELEPAQAERGINLIGMQPGLYQVHVLSKDARYVQKVIIY